MRSGHCAPTFAMSADPHERNDPHGNLLLCIWNNFTHHSNMSKACQAVKALDNLHSGCGNSTMCAASMPPRKGLSQ